MKTVRTSEMGFEFNCVVDMEIRLIKRDASVNCSISIKLAKPGPRAAT